MKKNNCPHENQHYTHSMSRYGCHAWNVCNDCGAELPDDIEKAEESEISIESVG